MSFKKNRSYLVFFTAAAVAFIFYLTNNSREKKQIVKSNKADKKDNTSIFTEINYDTKNKKSKDEVSKVISNDTAVETIEKPTKSSLTFDRSPAQVITEPKLLRKHDLLNNSNWKIWSNTVVLRSDVSASNLGSPIANVSNLSIYEQANKNNNLSNFNILKPIAVFNDRLKISGVITGTIKVETQNKSELINFLRINNATISDEFDLIQTYFIKSNHEVFNLDTLFRELKSQSYLQNVEIEIIYDTLVKS